jgi:hypothetical protein
MVPAHGQTPGRAKLTINSINLRPSVDGFFNGNVGLTLQRAETPQQAINFNLQFQHVKTLAKVYNKLRPEIDHLADELKTQIH